MVRQHPQLKFFLIVLKRCTMTLNDTCINAGTLSWSDHMTIYPDSFFIECSPTP